MLLQVLVEECENFLAVFEGHEILVAVVALGVGAKMHAVSAADFGDALGKQSAVLIGNDCVGQTLLDHGGRNVLVNHVVGAYGAQKILVFGAESKVKHGGRSLLALCHGSGSHAANLGLTIPLVLVSVENGGAVHIADGLQLGGLACPAELFTLVLDPVCGEAHSEGDVTACTVADHAEVLGVEAVLCCVCASPANGGLYVVDELGIAYSGSKAVINGDNGIAVLNRVDDAVESALKLGAEIPTAAVHIENYGEGSLCLVGEVDVQLLLGQSAVLNVKNLVLDPVGVEGHGSRHAGEIFGGYILEFSGVCHIFFLLVSFNTCSSNEPSSGD